VARARSKKVQRYTAQFKLQAVRLSHLEGVQVQDVAEALDIHPFMLGRWRKEVREGTIKAKPVAIPKEARRVNRTAGEMDAYARLKRSHALLKEEHEILKKFSRFSSAAKSTDSNS
jgi:transposase